MASKRIQGITVEIGGDTSALAESLEKVDKNIKHTQTQLKDVEKLLKLDPTNTELLSQKQRLLADAVDETKDKLKTLKNASEEAAKTKDNYDAWKEKITPVQTEITKTADELNNLKKKSKEANEQLSKGEISQEEYDKIQREIFETEQNLRDLEQQTESSRTALVNLGKSGEGLQKAGGKISGVGQSLLPVTAAITGVGVAGASSFAEVDKTMQLANKTMGNTAEEAEAVNNAMKEFAANSTFGMKDVSTAILNFARSGLKANQSISALTPAMNLAAGEGGELDTVSAGLVGTINSFGASFDETGHYADVFTAACNNSALDVNSLSDSMSIAAPIFTAASYKIEDTALAIGLMADKNIEASVAATSLKTGISRLAGGKEGVLDALASLGFETDNLAEQEARLSKAQDLLEEKNATLTAKQKKYNEVLEKYGENSSQATSAQASLVKAQNDFEQAQNVVNALTEEAANGTSTYGALMIDEYGKMRPFEAVLKDLQAAFAELSEQEQISAATALFGTNQIAPWLALLNTAPERVDELSESLHNSNGLTQEMADTMMSGFGGGIEKLKSSIDVLIYNIGESLAPILQKVIDFVQHLTDKFNALSPAQKETIVKIALIAAALGPLLIVMGKVISAVGTLMTVISKMPAIISKVKGGFTAVKAALTGATGTFLAVIAVIAVLAAAFVNLWKNNEDFRNKITSVWNEIKKTFTDFTQGIVDRLNALGFEFEDITEVLKAVWKALCDFLKPIFEEVFQEISDIFKLVTDTLLNIFDVFAALFQGDWEGVWNGIKNFFVDIWDFIVSTLENIMNMLCDIFGTDLENVKAFWTDVWNSINDFFVNTWNEFQENFQIGMDAIKKFWTDVWNSIKDFFVNTWETIKNNVSEKLELIKSIVSTVWDKIKTNISEKMNLIKSIVTNIWDKIKSGISNKITDIKDIVTDGFDKAVNYVKNLADDAWTWGADIIGGIVDGIKSKISDITNAVTDVADTIREYLHFSVLDKGPLTDYESWMPDFMKGLAKGIDKSKKYIETAINGVSDAMRLTMNSNLAYSMDDISGAMINGSTSGIVNNYYQTDNSRTVNQTNNSPKSLSRLEIYRQTRNALKM